MPALTIFLAPTGFAAGVREVLTDWSASGIIDNFVWIEPMMMSATRISGVMVESGRQQAVSLDELAAVNAYGRVRLCVLVPAVARDLQIAAADSQRVVEFLESSFGGIHVVRARAIITRIGETQLLEGLAHGGWHNLVLAPEASSAPHLGRTLLHATKDPIDWGIYAAATCAGVLALWAGCEQSPLDDEQPLPGESARLVRAYYRNLDASTVESELRNHVTSMEEGLPLPAYFGSSVLFIENQSLATKTMSDQLWVKHKGILKGPRERALPQKSTPIGAWAALKMMFGFLWAAIKNAPRSWVHRVASGMKADAAAAVHGLVFGSAPSQYTVIVDGVTPDGLPASWLEIADAAETLDGVLEKAGIPGEHYAHADMSYLWQDYAAGAMTLADGGERLPELPPVQVGPQRAVLRHASSAVPDARSRFHGVPPHLAAAINLEAVEPFDVLGVQNLERRLQHAASDPHMGVPASATLLDLRQWMQRFSDSFAIQVGTRIGHSLTAVASEVQTLLTRIRQAASADHLLTSVLGRQKKLALTMKILLAGFLIGLAVIVVLVSMLLMEPGVGAIAGAVVFLVWIVTTFLVFVSGQKELFRLLNARRDELNDDETTRKNLRYALTDLRRLGDAYEQFLAWSRVLGVVLQEPFGRTSVQTRSASEFLRGLPLNARIGCAAVEEETMALAAAELRRKIFTVGWLSRPWELAILNAGRQIGASGYSLNAQPQSIFAQPGEGEHSILRAWTQVLAEQGVDSEAGQELWRSIVKELEDGSRTSSMTSLLTSVEEVHGPALVRTSLEQFMNGLDDSGRQADLSYFDDTLLTDHARNSGLAKVETSIRFSAPSGLGRCVGLTQFSRGIPEHEFVVAKSLEEGHWWGNSIADSDGREDESSSFSIPDGPRF
jgi:hypothetical protein